MNQKAPFRSSLIHERIYGLGRQLAAFSIGFSYFPRRDSNPHKQIQSLSCYHYTTGECLATELKLPKYIFLVKRPRSAIGKRDFLSRAGFTILSSMKNDPIRALALVDGRFCANWNIAEGLPSIAGESADMGWVVDIASVLPLVEPCAWAAGKGLPALRPGLLVGDIGEVSAWDILVSLPGRRPRVPSWFPGGNSGCASRIRASPGTPRRQRRSPCPKRPTWPRRRPRARSCARR